MRVRSVLPLFFLSAALIAVSQSCSRGERTIISNVNVITMTSDEVLEDRDVIIEGGRIAGVVESGEAGPGSGDTVIDGTGEYLIPGLADMHVHLYVFDHGKELPLFVANGVTTVMDCNGRDHVLAFRDEIAAGSRSGPRIICSTPTIRGYEDEPWTLVAERMAEGYDAVKFYSNFGSRESFHRAMAEAEKLGAYTLGHIPYTVGLNGVIEEGMDEIAHVEEICWEFADFDRQQDLSSDAWLELIVGRFIEKYGSMGPEEMRSALRERAEVLAKKVKDNDIIVSTTCTYNTVVGEKIFEPAKFARRPALKYLPAEYFAALGMGREKHQLQFEGIEDLAPMWSLMLETMLRALHEQGVLITAGTDSIWYMGLVPGFCLHDELEYLVSKGFTPYEALRTATFNAGESGRRIDGLEAADFGTIEPGKRADLVLLDANPLQDISNTRRISGVMAGGAWHPQQEIDAMLDFDPAVHQAQLALFDACFAVRQGDALPLDKFIESTDCEEAKECVYNNRRMVALFIEALHEQGRDARAAVYFDAAVRANWDDVNYLNGICWNVGVEMKIDTVYPGAIAAADRALEINRHPAILDTQAWLFALSGDYEKALAAIEEAKGLDPENAAYEETRIKISEMREG